MVDDAPQPSEEEKARLAKLLAETELAAAEKELLAAQLQKAERENVAAEFAAKSLPARYWFIPTAAHVFQWIGAVLVLASAFFLLYQPVIDAVREVTEKEGKLATLGVEIAEKQNKKLQARLEETEEELRVRKERLEEQEMQHTGELENLADELKDINEDKKKAILLAESLKTRFDDLALEYKQFEGISETEKEKFQKLAEQAEKEAEELAKQLQTLQKQASISEQSAARVRKQIELRPFRDCPDCPQMVVIPKGNFMMGSPSNEEDHNEDEGPQHPVTIRQPLAVGKYEVTFGEWDACVAGGGCGGYRPHDSDWGRGNRPAINVSWDDAQAYLRWLSRKTGAEYRLLSEAEWEYAARAGTTTPFHFGPTISPDQANYDGDYTYGSGRKGVYRKKTVPIGSFPSNAFGLHDVHGNVWEWVADCWNGSYAGAPSDGAAWTTGDCEIRVLRGGSWRNYPRFVRAAGRGSVRTDYRGVLIGFRVARTLP